MIIITFFEQFEEGVSVETDPGLINATSWRYCNVIKFEHVGIILTIYCMLNVNRHLNVQHFLSIYFFFAACHVNTKELSHCYAVYFTNVYPFIHQYYSFLFWWINHFLIVFLLIHERETQKRNVCAIELYLILYM